MARPMGARRAPSRRSYCGDKFALDWQHLTQSEDKSPSYHITVGDNFAIMSACSSRSLPSRRSSPIVGVEHPSSTESPSVFRAQL